jgi:hypothetical protein
MIRVRSRTLAAVGAFAVAVSLGAAVPAGAVPSSGQVDSMQDLKGAWLTSLAGFQEGQPVNWQHRLTVRKVKGSAAVAFEEWRDCADHAAECKAGKVTGGGWSTPSRVLLAMDPRGVVHGVGATGSIMLTTGEDGMSAVMLSAGQQDDWTAMPDPTAMNRQRVMTSEWGPSYAATGPTTSCPAPPAT